MAVIKAVEVHRALKVVLGINYRFHWLDVEISPLRTTWYAAVQFRNDPKRNWHPRITSFYPGAQKVSVHNKLGDEGLWVEASTIIEMANIRAQSPTPPLPRDPKIS